jgi:heat shock protein HslJ
MAHRHCIVLATCAAFAACAISDPNLAPRSGAPSYGAAGAMPPTLTPSANDLSIGTWHWQRTQFADGRTITAAAPDRYTLTFEGGGRMLVRADCNRGTGAYEVNGNAMKLGPAALTKMGCPASQDADFVQPLARVTSYAIADGELVLTLSDGGAMRLKANR